MENQGRIQWHPGFYGATELEFRQNKEDLVFITEMQLSKEPLRMDMLIIKKRDGARLKNEIGYLFKSNNILEYKNPDDSLSIDDFYKTLGYACLYKALAEKTDEIPADTISVMIARESYPRKLITELRQLGNEVALHSPGIYYVKGNTLFDVQIIVMNQLSPENHSAYRILSRNAHRADISRFLTEAAKFTNQGDRHNADAVLQVTMSANPSLFARIRKEDSDMCEALRTLMADDINAAKEEGIKEGIKEGTLVTLISLSKDDFISVKEAARRAGMAEDAFREKMALYS